MFLLKETRMQNEKGFVLVAVIILTIVMMILAIGMISLNSSQAISTQHQIDRLKAEQLAKGAHWYNYMSVLNTGSSATAPNETLDGKTFSITTPAPSSGTGPYNTDEYQFIVTNP